jgi:uncharacterized membrane protein YwaF
MRGGVGETAPHPLGYEQMSDQDIVYGSILGVQFLVILIALYAGYFTRQAATNNGKSLRRFGWVLLFLTIGYALLGRLLAVETELPIDLMAGWFLGLFIGIFVEIFAFFVRPGGKNPPPPST